MEVAGANRRWRLQFRYRGSRRESAVAQLSTLGSMTRSHTFRLVCHAVALIIEAVGTLFIFLDVRRMNARFPSEPGVIGTVGDPLGYRVWYYHCADFGFAMLFLGMIVAGVVLWLEHATLPHDVSCLPPAPPQTPDHKA